MSVQMFGKCGKNPTISFNTVFQILLGTSLMSFLCYIFTVCAYVVQCTCWLQYTGASLRIRFHLTHRASDFIKSLARMKFHSPGKYFVKTYIHLFLLFNTNILYSLLLINMKCFLILLNIYDLQIFFCFFISVSTTDKINFGFVISVTFDI